MKKQNVEKILPKIMETVIASGKIETKDVNIIEKALKTTLEKIEM